MLKDVSKTNTASTASPRPVLPADFWPGRAMASASSRMTRHRRASRIHSWNLSRRLVCSMASLRNFIAAHGSGLYRDLKKKCRAIGTDTAAPPRSIQGARNDMGQSEGAGRFRRGLLRRPLQGEGLGVAGVVERRRAGLDAGP